MVDNRTHPGAICTPPQKLFLTLGVITLCLISGFISVYSDLSRLEKELAREASVIQQEVSRRLGALEVVLTGVVGLYQASDEVTEVEFSTLVTELLRPYPHVLSVLSLQKMNVGERISHEEMMRESGYISYRFTEFDEAGGLRTAGERPSYLPIVLIEPMPPKLGQLLGYDVASNPTLRPVIGEVSRTGKIKTAPLMRLLRDKDSLLAFKALYQGRYAPNTEEERGAMSAGFIAVELDPVKVLYGVLPVREDRTVALRYANGGETYSPDSSTAQKTVFAYDLSSYFPVFREVRPMEIYGQTAVLEITRRLNIQSIRVGSLLLALLGPGFFMLIVIRAWRKQRISRLKEERLQETIKEDHKRFENVVGTAFDAIIVLDSKGTVLTWNRQAETLLGWRSEEIVGQPLPNGILPIDDSPETMQEELEFPDEQALNWHIESMVRHRDGSRFPVEMAISMNMYGNHFQQSVFIRDIRVRKAQEEWLQNAKEAAEAGSLAKSQFLATISHEIRTPMNGVLGMLQLLLGTEQTAMQREYSQSAYRSGQSLLELINNILDFSKIEARKLKIANKPFDLREVVEDVMRLLSQQATQKHLEFLCEIPEVLNTHVMGDGSRLFQVLLNLANNAVKFTDQGRVTLNAAMLSETTEETCWRFEVRDTGIGIEADQLESIFDVFTQADNSATRRYGGTGLGLAVSRELVDLMGGKIEVDSKPGEGSTFRFTVRFGHASDLSRNHAVSSPDRQRELITGEATSPGRDVEETGALPATENPRYSTLLVEDNLVNREVAAGMLELFGCSVDVAENGVQAIEQFDRQSYDLILMDCHMPELDGFEATKAIREMEGTGNRTPIIALTADVQQGIERKCTEAGMDGYLSKPFTQEALRSSLKQWLPLL